VRAGAADEAALLAHQPVHPGIVERLILRCRPHLITIRCEVAQRVVVFVARPIGGGDRPVVIARAHGDLGRREEFAVAHAAQRPVPLAHAFGAQVRGERRPAPGWTAGCRSRPAAVPPGSAATPSRRRHRRPAEFVIGQAAVEVGLAGDLGEQRVGLLEPTAGAVGATQPVDPGRLRGERRRHSFDRRADAAPVLHAQRGAHLPRCRLFGERASPARRYHSMASGRCRCAACGQSDSMPRLSRRC
jgi:hypothetical protein